MQKRYRDQEPRFNLYTLLHSTGVSVCCSHCGGEAVAKLENGVCVIRCQHCYAVLQRICQRNVYAAKSVCQCCGRWIRVPLNESKVQMTMARVACPYCGSVQNAQVSCVGSKSVNPLRDIVLYYQASYRSQLVWALSCEHLNYLISFISAGLRERALYQDAYGEKHILRTGQAQNLPKFLLQAKNRAGILKLLLKMRDR